MSRVRGRGLSFYRRKRSFENISFSEVLRWIVIELSAVLFALVFTFSLGLKTSVIGVSMEPFLYNGQEILVNRLVYNFVSPKKGDVIVFLPGGNQNSHYYVKRVVAVPGETVQIRDSRLYVDNALVEEEGYDRIADPGIAENELILGNDEYFVLGDNRNNSEDSRSANIGLVKKSSIVGKAWYHMAASGDGMGFVH